MKNFQQNLLIFFALALCALCAWQWYFQTIQRKRIDLYGASLSDQAAKIQGYTNSLAGMDAEITGLQSAVTDLKQTVTSNNQAIVERDRENLHLQIAADTLKNEILQYESVTNVLTDAINKRNTAITNLVAQRDEFIIKYNDSVKARNHIVQKYNDLVHQIETNKPSH